MQETEKRLTVALFIDGQSLLPFNFKTVNRYLEEKRYDPIINRVYLTNDLIKGYNGGKKDIVGALCNNGFEPVLAAHLDNVDSYLVRDATLAMCKNTFSTIIIGSADGDMLPLFYLAKEYGMKTVLMHKAEAENHKVCCALKKTADEVVNLSELEEEYKKEEK